MNFKQNFIQYVIDIVTLCVEKMIEFDKENKTIPGKDKWETLNVIPLMPLLEVNHRKSILHMSKIMVYYYSTDESINIFAIGYMINPSLNCNKVFREQVEKILIILFHDNKIETVKDCLSTNNVL